MEIHESFLPEPLILSILMETKTTPFHLSIEKQEQKQAHLPSQNISKVLFAGKDHKGYKWMADFLALMHKIRFTTSQKSSDKGLIMTQYTLKLLTILSNILVTNLQKLDEARIEQYVMSLLAALRDSMTALQLVRPLESKEEAFFVGCSLLKELAFAFVSYVRNDVPDKLLQFLLIQEYKTILESLIDSCKLFSVVEDPKIFGKFLEAKRKKMNMEMMILCDCVTAKQSSTLQD